MGRKTRTVLNDILGFCLLYPELCQSLFLYLGGGTDHFERLGGGWDYRFKQNVLCHVTVYCVVLYCHTMCLCRVVPSRTVSRFVMVIRILKCTIPGKVEP